MITINENRQLRLIQPKDYKIWSGFKDFVEEYKDEFDDIKVAYVYSGKNFNVLVARAWDDPYHISISFMLGTSNEFVKSNYSSMNTALRDAIKLLKYADSDDIEDSKKALKSAGFYEV